MDEDAIKPHRERFIELFFRDHDLMGRVLKCHLVVEHYIEKYLIHKYEGLEIESAKLTFFQKASLIPADESISDLKPGILELNSIRNKFGHNLEVTLTDADIPRIKSFLKTNSTKNDDPETIKTIERFCAVVCGAVDGEMI